MEHLQLPSTSTDLWLNVPCLRLESFAGPFALYLADKNLTEAQLLTPERHGLTKDQAMSHVQSWLFFGTLRELAVGSRSHDEATEELQRLFVEAEAGDNTVKRISTGHLSTYWERMQQQVQESSQEVQDNYRRKIRAIMELSNRLVSDIDQSVLEPSHQAVVLSVMLLNEFIMNSADLREMEMERPFFRSLLVESAMSERGWCPSDIERLHLDHDITTLIFTARCGAPPCRKNHNACSRLVCEARQILPTEDYEPRHTTSQCACEHFPVNLDVALLSLDEGVIPVCRFFSDSETDCLETIRVNQVSSYVAISHVWSDRLGNRSANAMPRCLLKYLQEKVDSLYPNVSGPVAFWIDTLSCPVAPESATDQAIALMRETYAEADKVLVLDSYLESLKWKEMTVFECALRITCTGWTKRLWTLQEGILAKHIFFQFADGAVDGDEIFTRLWQPPVPYGTAPIIHEWMEIRSNWKDSDSRTVWMLYRALHSRTTSVATDEPLCLSTLTGVDLKEIVSVRKEDRMKRFWQLYDKLDTTILYWDGPRLQEPGLGWAPTSLLSMSPEAFLAYHYRLITDGQQVTRTEQGIVFRSQAILLGAWKAEIGKFWLRCEDNKWYHVTLTRRVGLPPLAGESSEGGDQSETRISVLALLMPTTLDQAFRDLSLGRPRFQLLF